MNEKIINEIVWWIPIKKLRDKFRAKFKEENKTEVHAALKTVASAIEHAQNNYNNYED